MLREGNSHLRQEEFRAYALVALYFFDGCCQIRQEGMINPLIFAVILNMNQ